MGKTILGVDAGGQSFKFALLDYDSLEQLDEVVYLPIDSDGKTEDLLGVFREVSRQGMEKAKKLELDLVAVAFSSPGPLDYYQGISLMDHKWASIKGINLVKDLHSHGLPSSIPVFFCHDAHCLILGEIAMGKAGAFHSIGGFIIGTGLGFGIVKAGRMEANELGIPKFGLYKRPYKDATIEAYVASKGIPRIYDQLSGRETCFDARRIGLLAKEGDEVACETYHSMGRALALTVADLVNSYSLDCMVFGGRISNSFEIFAPAFAEELAIHCKRVPYIYQSQGSEVLSMKGAALYAKQSGRKRGYDEKVL
ncbi:ROK family protein [uncultured Sphaerochaeta sp.]|uniref:ROK family protein n=1 Tax=uncultured Sphaerochaeta sp. TaxID=886478 RepID=UPI002A0A1762|nr:ROK family protein [uncultured Sphaerochaeta sp.]